MGWRTVAVLRHDGNFTDKQGNQKRRQTYLIKT
jgi:hypothetical protein